MGPASSNDEAEGPSLTKSKTKQKKRSSAPISAFSLLIEDEGDGEEGEEQDISTDNGRGSPALCVGHIISNKPHPKADHLRVCRVDTGNAHGVVNIVTNAVEVAEGMLVVVAPVGCTTPGSNIDVEKASLRGVDSNGMLCSAYDIGWTDQPDNVLVQLPADEFDAGATCPSEPPEGAVWGGSEAMKDEKGKKQKAMDAGSTFAALDLAEDEEQNGVENKADEEEELAALAQKEGKKKKKKTAMDTDALFAALEQTPNDLKGGMLESFAGEKKKAKKKKAIDFDVEALLSANGDKAAAKTETQTPAAEPDNVKKREKSRTAVEDEELDAILAEIDAPKKEDAAKAKKDKKKKKGKGGAAQGGDDEDLDAILAELGLEKKEPAAPAPATTPSVAEAPANNKASGEEKAGEAADADDGDDEGDAAGKELSAAAKKKAKKKAKEKAKKAGGGEEGAAEEAGAGGKKPAKVSAAVRKVKEALEAKRKAEEEAVRLAEEQRLREEEEERRREEEEARKKEEAERRKAEKAARRDQLKREGKLLTGKAKAEAERMARAREQLLRQAGVDPTERELLMNACLCLGTLIFSSPICLTRTSIAFVLYSGSKEEACLWQKEAAKEEGRTN